MAERRKKHICFDEEGLAALKKFVADEAIIETKAHMSMSPETKEAIDKVNKTMENLVSRDFIEEKFVGLKDLIELQFKQNSKDHNAVWEQVKLTNGSVKNLKAWKLALIYGFIALTSVVSFVFPILTYYYTQNQDKDISIRIQAAINNNNDKYFETKLK